jgi:MtrB/PioB family decaheme-associated outer membrane protein
MQYELAGDYRLDSKQHIRLAYNRENIQRWCNDYAIGGGTPAYTAGTACVVAPSSKDDKLSLTYRLNATENVHLNAGYSYSNRNTDFDTKARTAFIEVGGGGIGNTVTGLNGGDFIGFHPFFEADRIQQMLKGGVDWQVNDKLSMNVNGRYTDDDYKTDYGFQNGKTWSINLDASFQYSENGSANAYVTKEHRGRDMTNLQTLAAIVATGTKIGVPAGGTWSNTLEDDDITFGLGAKHSGLMKGKLVLAGDVTYSLGETSYGTVLNYNGVDSTGRNCSNANYLTCGTLPDVQNRLIQVKLSGDYKVNKSGTVGFGYIYQNLSSDDYYYNAYQIGFTPTKVMPTNQQSGSYSVNAVVATYTYSFQ